ncbi:MAG TPA: SDR family oxidoreductase [Chryseolinea sp.]|nr:SDR family oxidoreductase [Chryseolinea sp.]
MSELKNKVIWLTGASSGIGEALAYELADKGAKLILSARRKEELERVKGNCKQAVRDDIRILPLDLAQPQSLEAATKTAIQFHGHVDVLINNGGISQRSLALESSMDVYRRLMEVNFFGAVALTKYILPHFVSRKQGHIATLSSVAGKYGTPYRSGYAASKHALHGFFDSVRAEHFKDNVTITMLCPGVINTPITMSALTGDGTPMNKMDEWQSKGKPVKWCAEKIVHAIENKKEEAYIGGKEVFLIYIRRFLPFLYYRIIRNVKVR